MRRPKQLRYLLPLGEHWAMARGSHEGATEAATAPSHRIPPAAAKPCTASTDEPSELRL